MKSTICALNLELAEVKKMLVDNQPLVSLGAQLSKLNTINKLPSSLAVDIFYAMDQTVITKASPESISLGGVLIVGVLLTSLGINDNKIIYGILNCVPSSSNLWHVVEKSCEATFMTIAGFVFNYPCSMSFNKGERAGLGRLAKDTAFWGAEQVQQIRLDVDASKGISE